MDSQAAQDNPAAKATHAHNNRPLARSAQGVNQAQLDLPDRQETQVAMDSLDLPHKEAAQAQPDPQDRPDPAVAPDSLEAMDSPAIQERMEPDQADDQGQRALPETQVDQELLADQETLAAPDLLGPLAQLALQGAQVALVAMVIQERLELLEPQDPTQPIAHALTVHRSSSPRRPRRHKRSSPRPISQFERLSAYGTLLSCSAIVWFSLRCEHYAHHGLGS